MSYRFRALVNFFSEETRSQYAAELIYTVADDNEKLDGLARQWADAGQVEILEEEPGTVDSQASGEGTVE